MSIFRQTAVVSFFTGLCRILGFVREIVMAHFFGTSLAKSAFDVAFRIPNLFRNLFGEGALSAAFIPVFAETLEKDGVVAAKQLAGRVMTMLATFLVMIAAATTIVVTIAIHHVADGSRAAAVLPLLRIIFPYVVFICIVALCMGILNAVNHFATPAATPTILNLVWIAAVFLICPRMGNSPETRIYGVAWAIIVAGIIQLAAQVPALLYHGVFPEFLFSWKDSKVRHILLLLGPAAAGMGVYQLNVVVDGILALWVGPWAPAALSYAERLIYLPLGLFATALGTVLLPAFAKHAAANRISEIPGMLARSMSGLMLVMIPASFGLMAICTPIVRLSYQTGQFDSSSTILTSRALAFYAPGLIVFSLYKVLVPGFYALKDTRTPVKIGLAAVGLNFVLNIFFILTLPTYYKHAGLALATVIASAANGAALAVILTRRIGSPGWHTLGSTFLRVLLCASVMFVGIRALLLLTSPLAVFSASTKPGQLLTVIAAIAMGTAIYIPAILIFCRRECREIMPRRKCRIGSL